MADQKHMLIYRVALPKKAKDDEVANVLQATREALKDIAGPWAHKLEFQHRVEDKQARAGGPKGNIITVRYVQVACRFAGVPTGYAAHLKSLAESDALDAIVKKHTGMIK